MAAAHCRDLYPITPQRLASTREPFVKNDVKKIVAVMLLSSAVGCMSTDPYTGEQKTSNTAKGAGIGAVAGAVLGAATSSKGDRKKGILTGAALGGAVGAGSGFYMDKQEAKLREQLASSGVRVQREGDNIRLIMPGNITFATNSAQINGGFHQTLDSINVVLKEYQKTQVKISGHTDSTGNSERNQTLSEDRAESVRQYLVSGGLKAGRVQTAGYGSRRPIADNGSAAGREQNRRVELELLPL
jgi:outer membrane protein OmpA-like peptidoglycan-associated protein